MTRRCLDKLKEVTVDFGLAQLDAGADALTLPDHATGDLVHARYYDTFLRDIHAEFAARLPAPVILHICGKTLDRMRSISKTGLAAFHFDSKNDPAASVQAVEDRIALVGNVNNPVTLLHGSPAEVRQAVHSALDAGVPLIAPECAVPLNTPVDNLAEIPRAVRSFHDPGGKSPKTEAGFELPTPGSIPFGGRSRPPQEVDISVIGTHFEEEGS